eukprot:365069-Chlamydomonas_euryale.AAC.9
MRLRSREVGKTPDSGPTLGRVFGGRQQCRRRRAGGPPRGGGSKLGGSHACNQTEGVQGSGLGALAVTRPWHARHARRVQAAAVKTSAANTAMQTAPRRWRAAAL